MSENIQDLPLSCELLEYSVLHTWTEVTEKQQGSTPISIRPDIRVSMNEREYSAFILCEYGIDRFKFRCALDGRFRFGEPLSAENVGNAWVNACTMLYGIARGLFSNSVMQAIHKPYFLPSVMMANYVNRRLQEIKEANERKAVSEKNAPPSKTTPPQAHP